MKLIAVSCILISMAAFSARVGDDNITRITQDTQCARALAWIDTSSDWVTDQQVLLTEIPAPIFGEAKRGNALKTLFQSMGLKVRTDPTGNVTGELAGSDDNSIVMLVAHLDTVFPADTDVHVKRVDGKLQAPGISDNGAGLAALVGLAKAFSEAHIKPSKTIILAGDVGEEGEGNLRGIRALVETYQSRLDAVIAVDGPSTEHITTQGIASRRIEVSISGPGGHSWSDFGAPNPITALSRGIVQFSSIRVPDDPRSTYNFGVVEGGSSVNSIPGKATVKVDLRSEDEAELDRMENALRSAMQAGVKEESPTTLQRRPLLQLNFQSLGTRPAGKLADGSTLVQAIRDADRYLGNRSRLERSSTDANIPLSLGIPAVAVGGGGRGGGSHTLGEWYDPSGREMGLKRLFLATMSLAGVQP